MLARAFLLFISILLIPSNAYAYNANGQLKSLTYGNGHLYTSTQNARQQTATMTASNGAVTAIDYAYNYHANGQVDWAVDRAVAGQTRGYTYDGLSRLKTASGPWGDATYTYDALNNLLSKQLGPRTVGMVYDGQNRLSAANDSAETGPQRVYTYDARGNITHDGRVMFDYDRSNQPVAMSGDGVSGVFTYDANYKRAKQVMNGETIYSVYTSGGALQYRYNETTGVVSQKRTSLQNSRDGRP